MKNALPSLRHWFSALPLLTLTAAGYWTFLGLIQVAPLVDNRAKAWLLGTGVVLAVVSWGSAAKNRENSETANERASDLDADLETSSIAFRRMLYYLVVTMTPTDWHQQKHGQLQGGVSDLKDELTEARNDIAELRKMYLSDNPRIATVNREIPFGRSITAVVGPGIGGDEVAQPLEDRIREQEAKVIRHFITGTGSMHLGMHLSGHASSVDVSGEAGARTEDP